jgi:hypothetical protein
LIGVSLSLGNSFHLSRVTVLVRDNNARIFVESLRDSDFVEISSEEFLPPRSQWLISKMKK